MAVTIAATAALGACSGVQQAIPTAPATLQASDAIARPDACPSFDLACVIVSQPSGASVGLCVVNGQIVTKCSGQLPSYTWSGKFYTNRGKLVTKLYGAFDPNPANPTEDTIVETKPLKSSNGRYHYYQLVKACSGTACVEAKIGVATE
jgi:hypothetical protein